ncbi:PASTA domain-containing protein [bacterium 3DAC]|nr:PASTA domain-containing protein [bacterium 3DAC]
MRKVLRYLVHVLLLATLIWGVIGLGMYYWLTDRERVSVGRRAPDVSDMYISDAITKLWESDLSFDIKPIQADISVGYVVAQIPVPGTLMGSGEKVTLIVSTGLNTATVPAVVGMDAADAIKKVRDAGLRVKDVIEVPDGGNFVVKSITPGPGSKLALGEGVVLTVSIPEEVRVPYVVGLPLPIAEKKITDVGLKVGKITYKYVEGIKLETVKAQFPRSGIYRWKGETVDLEVWTGDYQKTVQSDQN